MYPFWVEDGVRSNTNWSFEPDLNALVFVDIGCRWVADEGGVADGENVAVGIEKADEIESWTSRQNEYLHRRRAAFKGVITKNTKKAKDIVARNGSRTVIRCVKERVCEAFQDAYQTTKHIIALLSAK